MSWHEDLRLLVKKAVKECCEKIGYPGKLVVSSTYDLMGGTNPETYPNADHAGVYIFLAQEGILNVGKSKNCVGKQLQDDARTWITDAYFNEGRAVMLVTVKIAVIHGTDGTEYPLALEQCLVAKLHPIRQNV